MKESVIKINRNYQPSSYYFDHLRRVPLINRRNGTSLENGAASTITEYGGSGCVENFCLYLRKYCGISTLHGFKYFTESERPWYEKCFWMVAVLSAIIGVVITIKIQINYYLSSPVVMTVNSERTPVWQVPFPAITICSDNQARLSLVNITKLLKASEEGNLSSDDLALCRLLKFFCREFNSRPLTLQENSTDSKEFYSYGLVHAAKLCIKIVKVFSWQDKFYSNPCFYMQTVPHNVGYCHSFNLLPPKSMYTETFLKGYVSDDFLNSLRQYPYIHNDSVSSWSLDEGYKVKKNGCENKTEVPYRISSGSIRNSATVVLDFGIDDLQEECMPASFGFLVFVHGPHEWPLNEQAFTYVEVNKKSAIHLQPEQTKTDESLRSWSPEERGCYYNNERQLMFFRIYSALNCNTECDANYTRNICNCNAFYQPRLATTPVCTLDKFECYQQTTKLTSDSARGGSHLGSCNCLPSCNELKYKISAKSLKHNFTHNNSGFNVPDNVTRINNIAVLYVFFHSRQFSSILRVALMSQSDFIANIGGLLGLFLGFSFISALEIIYFGTIRWMTDVWKTNKLLRKLNKTNEANSGEISDIYIAKNQADSNWNFPSISGYMQDVNERNAYNSKTISRREQWNVLLNKNNKNVGPLYHYRLPFIEN